MSTALEFMTPGGGCDPARGRGSSTSWLCQPDPFQSATAIWSYDTETYPKAQFTIRFADDQEIDWEVGHDLRPRKHPVRDW